MLFDFLTGLANHIPSLTLPMAVEFKTKIYNVARNLFAKTSAINICNTSLTFVTRT